VSQAYGSTSNPTELGGAGGGSSGSAGGAAINLTVARTLTLNGEISSHGADCTVAGCNAGAGGSVWINTTQIEGLGTVGANGGLAGAFDGTWGGAGGGGGRVALYFDSGAFEGEYTMHGGGGMYPGGPGTCFVSPEYVYVRKKLEVKGDKTMSQFY
jgi:hypothetical protein